MIGLNRAVVYKWGLERSSVCTWELRLPQRLGRLLAGLAGLAAMAALPRFELPRLALLAVLPFRPH